MDFLGLIARLNVVLSLFDGLDTSSKYFLSVLQENDVNVKNQRMRRESERKMWLEQMREGKAFGFFVVSARRNISSLI